MFTTGFFRARRVNCGTSGPFRILLPAAAVLASIALFSSPLNAQVFQPVAALAFTESFGGANPLPQNPNIAAVGTGFSFSITSATTNSGGSWLAASTITGCGVCATPTAISVSVNPGASLGVGTYTGQVVVTSQVGGVVLTIPVTLTIVTAGATIVDNLPGQLSFSQVTNSATPPASQTIQIRNGGSGTLSWTASTSTSDGGSWLIISSSGGTAPSFVTIGVVPANLPNGGLIAGTFVGQILVQAASGNVTIPVSVVLGNNIFSQVNPISFTKVFAGADPLPQTLTIASTGANFSYSVTAATATGGAWLSVSTITGCGFCATPSAIQAIITTSPDLPVGSYTGQIIVTAETGFMTITVPVTLTVASTGSTYLDNLPGQTSFSLVTNSPNSPVSQDIQVRDGGSGTLDWTLEQSTADGGNWLTVSATSGVAPSYVTVGVNVANLPNGGLTAGTFIGQVVVQTTGSTVTVPVSVVVGADVLDQVNPISFTKVFAGADPLPQTLSIASTGRSFNYSVAATTATGGSWLSVSTITGCVSCATASTIQAIITTSPTLPAGTYTGQIVVTAQTGLSMTIPVTLTVATAGTAFFDNVPGQMSFSMQPGGTIAGQSLQIRNAGTGTLDWTLEQSTGDGGNWLTVSATRGVAPSYVNVGVVTANLPNGGLTSGTFVGNLVFRTAGSSVTVPVSVVVGANVFSQVNPISFTMPAGGANPLPQTIEMSSTGANFNFSVAANNGNGGSWLTVSTAGGCEFCSTPNSIIATINASPTLAAGTYTGQIAATAQTGFMSVTIPVTLTVTMANTTTAVTSSVNPSVFGQPVTFTATVSPVAPGTGTPTGTVSFFDGANPISCIAAGTLVSGVATCTTSSLPVASHTITASYPGDANFIGSVGSLTGNPEVVSQASTSTTVTSSQNPQTAGQAVTFMATVSAVAPGTGTPSGTVTFLDGGSAITYSAPGTLSGGVATCTTSALAPGSQTITTSYAGDGNFIGSAGSLIGNPEVITGANVSSSASVTSTGLSYNRIKQQGTETVTVKNTSAQTISGPLELVLGLSAGVTAVNNTGTFNSNPYWTVTAGSLAPGASAQVTVTLGYASGTIVSTTSSVYSGSIP